MASRFLGYLTDRHLALYEVAGTNWRLIKEMTDEEAAGTLPELMHRDKPLHLLADVVEMEFRFEKATYLRGRDRYALHERKLLGAYRTSPYRHAFSLGREPGRRGEEKLLLSAITNPELVAPWVIPLRQNHLPMSGIASVPLLQNMLIKPLAITNPHILLLSAQRRGGIRVTYFFEKEMRFSRLAPHDGDVSSLGPAAYEEAVRTHQYLLSLRLVDRNSPIAVVSVMPDSALSVWQHSQPSAGNLHFEHFALSDIAKRAKIQTKQALATIDDLLIACLLKASYPNHLAPTADRHHYHVYWLRRSLVAASILLTLSTAGSGSMLFYRSHQHGIATRQAEAQTAIVNTEADKIRDSFPKTDVPLSEMREAITLTASLKKESAPTRQLFADLSRGFDAIPQAELQRLTWISSEAPESVTGDDTIGGGGNKKPLVAASEQQEQNKRWVAIISGQTVGAGSYRKAIALTDALRDAIHRDNIDAEVMHYPLNVRPDAELKEDIDRDIPERLPFRLRVIWKD